MARKQRQKKNWAKNLLVLILTPFVVWALAFVMWFYWYDIQRWIAGADKEPKPVAQSPTKGPPSQPAQKRSKESILDEDRKALEAILKQKSE